MAQTETNAERAFDQVVEWLEHFESLEDPRQAGKVLYPLDEVLLLDLIAVLAGAESWVEIAAFGKKKLDLLRRFRPFANGTPSHDQLGELVAALDAEQFQACFIAWVASLSKHSSDIVAVDGKTPPSVSRHETLEKSHGRIERRIYTAIGDIAWLAERHPGWKGLSSIVMVESERDILGGKSERETRFYISSLAADAERQGEAIRSHWGIENSHHWVMDMLFRDDECRIRTGNAPANFTTIKHMAGNLLRHGGGKHSLRIKRRLAAWDDDYLTSLITGA